MLTANSVSANKSRNHRRLYLFVLTTFCLALALHLLTTDFEGKTKSSVLLKFENRSAVENTSDDSVAKSVGRELLLAELKSLLAEEKLQKTIDSVAAQQELESPILKSRDVEEIKSNLMNGALAVEKESAQEDAESQSFRLTLTGSGSPDELLLLQLFAEEIQSATTPRGQLARIKKQLNEILDGIHRSKKLNQQIHTTVGETFKKFAQREQDLLAKLNNGASGTNPNESLLQSLRNLEQQRQELVNELNAKMRQPGSETDQQDLLRRIQYFDQQISEGKKRQADQRFAEGNRATKATFIESPNRGATGQVLSSNSIDRSNLEAEIALLSSDLQIAIKRHDDNIEAANQINQMFDRQVSVTLSGTRQSRVGGATFSRFIIWLGVGGLIAGVFVSRFQGDAFQLPLKDAQTIEESLQIPIIGQVKLPADAGNAGASDEQTGKQQIRSRRLVGRLIRGCELLLFILLLALVTLVSTSGNTEINLFQWFGG